MHNERIGDSLTQVFIEAGGATHNSLSLCFLCTDVLYNQGSYADFREIFADSGFKGNPEKRAFTFLKRHLGNLEYLGVSEFRIPLQNQTKVFDMPPSLSLFHSTTSV